MKQGVQVSRFKRGDASFHGKKVEDDQILPLKDLTLFETMTKLSDEKMYTRALKIANDLLKRHPNHGETLSMKAILWYYTHEDKNEAIQLAKRGLQANIQSSTCWHVIGIIKRSEKQFDEALRYFRQAHRLCPDALLLLRDLATLQTHQRDLVGLVETRKKVITLRPNLKVYWVAYAVANHFMGYYVLARYLVGEILRHYYVSCKEANSSVNQPQLKYEEGELRLYRALIFEEGGQYEEAIKELEPYDDIPDHIGRLEALGRLYIYVKRYPEAHEVFSQLFFRCCSNSRYLLCLFSTCQLFSSNITFPCSPLDWDQSQKQTLTKDLPCDENFSHLDQENPSTRQEDDQTPFLWLSPYALQPTRLVCPDNADWCFHPRHLLDPPPTSSHDVDPPALHHAPQRKPLWFVQLRPMTFQEELNLARWILSRNQNYVWMKTPQSITLGITDNKETSTDVLLRFGLDFFQTDSFFYYFTDTLLRQKFAKNTCLPLNMMQSFFSHPSKFSRLEVLLTQYYQAAHDNIHAVHSSCETISLSDVLGVPVNPPDELKPYCSCLPTDHRVTPLAVQALYPFLLLNVALLFMSSGQYSKALDILNEAIHHSPTIPDLYQMKARVLAKMVCYQESADVALYFRNMDLTDRYLNTECVKYCLRAGRLDEADKISVFHTTEQKKENLIDMQSMRYELLYGKAALRMGKKFLAFEYFYHVVEHFKEIHDDQLGFHLYALHTGALRHYLQFLRMENRLHSHIFYRRAVFFIVTILLNEYFINLSASSSCSPTERPSRLLCDILSTSVLTEEQKIFSFPPQQATMQKTASQQFNTAQEAKGQSRLKEHGSSLAEAWKLVMTLRHSCQLDKITHTLAYQVSSAQGQFAFMAQSLYRLWVLVAQDIYHPSFSPLFCHFLVYFTHDPVVTKSSSGSPTHSSSTLNKQVDTVQLPPPSSASPYQHIVNHTVVFLLQTFLHRSNGYSCVEDASTTKLTTPEFLQFLLNLYLENLIAIPTQLFTFYAAFQCLFFSKEFIHTENYTALLEQLISRFEQQAPQFETISFKRFLHLYKLIAAQDPPLLHKLKETMQHRFPAVSSLL